MSIDTRTKEKLENELKAQYQRISEMKTLERGRLAELEKFKIREQISQILLSTTGSEMYTRILQVVLKAFQSEYGLFGIVDHDGALVIEIIARRSRSKFQIIRTNVIIPSGQWATYTWLNGIGEKRPVVMNHCSGVALPGKIDIETLMSIPVTHQGEVIGILQTANKKAPYHESELRRLTGIAELIGPVLNTARERANEEKIREQEQKKSARHYKVLHTIRNFCKRIASIKEQETLLKETIDCFTKIGGYDICWIALLQKDGKQVQSIYSGVVEKERDALGLKELGKLPQCGRDAIEHGEEIVVSYPSKKCADCPFTEIGKGKIALSITLSSSKRVYGVMALSAPPEIALDESEQHLVKEVAGDMAFALERIETETVLMTTHRKIKRQLAEIEHLYRTSPIGLCLMNKSLRFVRINDTMAAMTGMPVEQHIGKSMEGILPELSPYLEPLCRKVIETGEPLLDCEIPWTTAPDVDKARKWLLNCYPVNLPDGKLLGIGISIQEITELKRADEALRESEQRLKLAVQVGQLGMWDFNPTSFADAHFNDQWLKMLDYEPDEKSQSVETWLDLLHPEDVTAAKNALEAHLNDGAPYNIQFRLRAKDNSYRYIHSIGKVISRDPDGDPNRMVGIHIDITDQKRAEKNRLLSEKKLRQAQKMEAIGTLAGGIAHDFNNILTSIIGFTELALDEAGKPGILGENLQEILTAGLRAKDLVNQILTFSRQSDEPLRPVQVNMAAKEALRLLRPTIPTNIEILHHLESRSIILGDPTHVHQIIMNLCTNAVYAMEESGGILEVGLNNATIDKSTAPGLDLEPGVYLQLTVADNGQGIPPEIIESIFEPYFSTKTEGEGTGLGLSAVHGIVKKYGGDISVQSTVGEGSVFRVYFPVLERQPTEIPDITAELPSGTEKVLFVDDEPQIGKMTKQNLEKLGYHVETRSSSIEALELFKKRSRDFDLVITDMTMPKLTGDKLAVELMRIKPDIPVILCTGYSRRISEEKAARIGIRAFAMKPLLKSKLAEIVRDVLDQADQPPQAIQRTATRKNEEME